MIWTRINLKKQFFIDVFEVTQKQNEITMRANPSEFKGDMRPVEKVRWINIRGSNKGIQEMYIEDPKGPAVGSSRILRGGSWNDAARTCRSSQRIRGDAGGGWIYDGFRLACSAETEK